jgi:hypothetical protein
MPHSAPEDPRLMRLTELCLALPEVARTVRGGHADYRVRKKAFAYFLHDHHGDGIVSACVRGAPGENVERAESRPELYYLPAYIGPRGWFGVRLDREPVDWGEIERLVAISYCSVAPWSLARLVAR